MPKPKYVIICLLIFVMGLTGYLFWPSSSTIQVEPGNVQPRQRQRESMQSTNVRQRPKTKERTAVAPRGRSVPEDSVARPKERESRRTDKKKKDKPLPAS